VGIEGQAAQDDPRSEDSCRGREQQYLDEAVLDEGVAEWLEHVSSNGNENRYYYQP
jgi:hypothetical protein